MLLRLESERHSAAESDEDPHDARAIVLAAYIKHRQGTAVQTSKTTQGGGLLGDIIDRIT